MKKITCLLLTVLAAPLAHAEIDVVYGQDNRLDIYQSKNTVLQSVAKSTAAMMPAAQFTKAAKDGFFNLKGAKTLEDADNICPSEAFSQQPAAAMCSGFLVAPDILITAGHCYKSFSTPEAVCKSFVWVFDFKMASEKADPTQNIAIQNIYLCKEIIKAELSQGNDYSIIRLNRAVTGRSPLKFRSSGKIADKTAIAVVGHPSGLPSKISDGGKVINNSNSSMFVTNLDTFHGNSGSAVVDASTGLVEGILVQGKTDYVPSKKSDANSCKVVNKCDDNGQNCASGDEKTPPGEMVFRISNIAQFIK